MDIKVIDKEFAVALINAAFLIDIFLTSFFIIHVSTPCI